MFKTVALLGAGAVGAYFIYGFSEFEDVSFCVVAEGERYERLKREGVSINQKIYRPQIRTPAEAKGVDLLLVCTKYHHLWKCLDMIEAIVDNHTVVMSLLNGIDSEDVIAERIGASHMIYSVTRISSERRDGHVHFVPETTIGISFGEKEGGAPSERVKAFADLMEKASLHYHVHEHILLDQWKKYAMNIIYNIPQAILGVGFGAYYDSAYVGAIRDHMYEEIRAVAEAEGMMIGDQADWRSACAANARFSTLQDMDAKRKTEIDMFADPLLRLAEKHGIKVPYCEFAFHAIRALEEKAQGRFDY